MADYPHPGAGPAPHGTRPPRHGAHAVQAVHALEAHAVEALDHLEARVEAVAVPVVERVLDPVIEVGEVRGTVLRALRLFAEAIIVPTVLLTVLLRTAGLVPALATAVGWCVLALALRWIFTRHVPGTLMLGACVVAAKAAIALATSSALVYLLSPALGSVFMALLFVGSAVLGRPITLRLARDFVDVPEHVLDRRGVRRMFTQVALIWGVSRILDAATSLVFLHQGLEAGLLSRSFISPAITVGAIGACTVFGVRSLRSQGVRVCLRHAPAAPAS